MKRKLPFRYPSGWLNGPVIRVHIVEHVRIDPVTECWNYGGKSDYPTIKIGGGMSILASRLSLWAFTGTKIPPYPEGVVMHSCDNPRCVNPNHLLLGTQQDNMRDCAAKGRMSQQKRTHCPQGHEYTPENTYICIERQCITCKRESKKARRRNAISIHRRTH